MNRRQFVQIKPSTSLVVVNDIDFVRLYQFLAEIAPLYPNFKSWFNFTFRRNMPSGERKIALAHNGDDIIGAALLKQSEIESKICTFMIAEQFRGYSIGNDLMDLALATLDDKEATITVSSERNDYLLPLLRNKGFELQDTVSGYYRTDSTEYFYSL